MTLHLSELELQLLLKRDSGDLDIYGFIKKCIEEDCVVVLRAASIPNWFGNDEPISLVSLSSYSTLLSGPEESTTAVITQDDNILWFILNLCHTITIGPEKYSDCTYVVSGVDANISLLIKRTTARLLADHRVEGVD
jgi:hypothetical protein